MYYRAVERETNMVPVLSPFLSLPSPYCFMLSIFPQAQFPGQRHLFSLSFLVRTQPFFQNRSGCITVAVLPQAGCSWRSIVQTAFPLFHSSESQPFFYIGELCLYMQESILVKTPLSRSLNKPQLKHFYRHSDNVQQYNVYK